MKKIIGLVLTLTMILSLVACSSTDTSDENGSGNSDSNVPSVTNDENNISKDVNEGEDNSYSIEMVTEGENNLLIVADDDISAFFEAANKSDDIQLSVDLVKENDDKLVEFIICEYDENNSDYNIATVGFNDNYYPVSFEYNGTNELKIVVNEVDVDFSETNYALIYSFVDGEELFFKVVENEDIAVNIETSQINDEIDDEENTAVENEEDTAVENEYVGNYGYWSNGEADSSDLLVITDDEISFTFNGSAYTVPYQISDLENSSAQSYVVSQDGVTFEIIYDSMVYVLADGDGKTYYIVEDVVQASDSFVSGATGYYTSSTEAAYDNGWDNTSIHNVLTADIEILSDGVFTITCDEGDVYTGTIADASYEEASSGNRIKNLVITNQSGTESTMNYLNISTDGITVSGQIGAKYFYARK